MTEAQGGERETKTREPERVQPREQLGGAFGKATTVGSPRKGTLGAGDDHGSLRARSQGAAVDGLRVPPMLSGNQLALHVARREGKSAGREGSGCSKCEELARGGLVQAKCDTCAVRSSPALDGARPALASASSGLPHHDRIQSSFGRHDLSSVRTKTGGDAKAASESIGARAFTSGDRIAFREAPDVWLAAHEAAHVVQQREGKSALNGGAASTEGFERHADRVADAVVGGRSAEPLLDEVARGEGGAPPALQLDEDSPKEEPRDPEDKRQPGVVFRVEYQGVWLSDDATELRVALEAWAAKRDDPHAALQDLAADVAGQKGVAKAPPALSFEVADQLGVCTVGSLHTAAQKPSHEADPDKRIALTLNHVVQTIIDDDIAWLQRFKSTAIEITNGFLDDNARSVRSELSKYGVRDPRIDKGKHFYSLPRVTGELDDSQSTRGLAIMAQGLINRKKTLDAANDKRKAIMHRALEGDVKASWELSPVDDEIKKANTDLDVFRRQAQQTFPILASFSTGELDVDKLQTLTALKDGKDPEASALIVDELSGKLVDIDKVRDGLGPDGTVNIWRVPKIVAGTRAQLKPGAESLKAKVLDETIAHEQPSAVTGILIGLLQIGLVIAAPATGGLSLIPAAGISVYSAYDEFKKYERESELHNTGFGAAALSAEEPSLFWLGVSIVGAGLDVAAAAGPALKLFRQLAPLAKAIKVGETGEEGARAISALEQAARDAGASEDAIRRMVEEATEIQKAGKSFGITAEEAETITKAGEQAAAEQLKEGAQAAATVGGHETKLSKAGDLFTCSEPCTLMRERFRSLIEREPAYESKIRQLEEEARGLPEGDPKRADVLNKAADLEREMRSTSPTDWQSPLKSSKDYDALVKKRGWAGPTLQGHPPNWSTLDEARFLYGAEAAEGIPSGYTFVLQENGELSVRRIAVDAEHPPIGFNPASGTFEAIGPDIVRAETVKGTQELKAFSELSPEAQAKMKASFKARTDLINQRDELARLGVLTEEDATKLSKLKGKVVDESRKIGEEAADDFMKGVIKDKGKGGQRLYPLDPNKPSTMGDFDRIYTVGDEVYVVEAKGGGGTLGTRRVGGIEAQQGTSKYLDGIVANMSAGTPEQRAAAEKIVAARNAGKLKYVLVRATIGEEGPGAVKSAEFLLK